MKRRGKFKRRQTRPKPHYRANLSAVHKLFMDQLIFGSAFARIIRLDPRTMRFNPHTSGIQQGPSL